MGVRREMLRASASNQSQPCGSESAALGGGKTQVYHVVSGVSSEQHPHIRRWHMNLNRGVGCLELTSQDHYRNGSRASLTFADEIGSYQ
jgi:hypothetical protein